jgi:hypothetical protein
MMVLTVADNLFVREQESAYYWHLHGSMKLSDPEPTNTVYVDVRK